MVKMNISYLPESEAEAKAQEIMKLLAPVMHNYRIKKTTENKYKHIYLTEKSAKASMANVTKPLQYGL